MEIQTGENTLLLLMINSYLSFVSFTTKFFEIFKKSFPSISRKSGLRGKSKLVISLAQGMCYLWARVEGWSDDSSFPFSLCAHLSV